MATNVYMKLMGPVDMKKKYKAEWALVTGAGTGETCIYDNCTYICILRSCRYMDVCT